jgi:branched-chain amino acid transport system permease protein
VSLALIVALYQFFERTLYGKACGPPPSTGWRAPDGHLAGAGRQAHLLPGGLHRRPVGVLIAPITTIYYDTAS